MITEKQNKMNKMRGDLGNLKKETSKPLLGGRRLLTSPTMFPWSQVYPFIRIYWLVTPYLLGKRYEDGGFLWKLSNSNT